MTVTNMTEQPKPKYDSSYYRIKIRRLGGLANVGCQSCLIRAAIFNVEIDGYQFLVCWECQP